MIQENCGLPECEQQTQTTIRVKQRENENHHKIDENKKVMTIAL